MKSKVWKDSVNSMESSQSIKCFFDKIASEYDLVNNLLSLGFHHHWNNRLLQLLNPRDFLLDVCSGTGDIAIKFLKKNRYGHAVLMDFSDKMLQRASVKGFGLLDRMSFTKGDVHALPFATGSIPYISISYGLRNLSFPELFLKEAYRVLKPQGRIGILELTRPYKWVGFHKTYVKFSTKTIGIFTKSGEAYRHLHDSIRQFPKENILSDMIGEAGFTITERRDFFYGTAVIRIADKLN